MELDLENTQKKIRGAWVCGLVFAALLMGAGIILGASESIRDEFGLSEEAAARFGTIAFLKGVFCILLSMGILLKSRLCSVLLCGEAIMYEVQQIVNGVRGTSALLISLAFTLIFINGAVGAFSYHIIRSRSEAPVPSILTMLFQFVGAMVVLILFGVDCVIFWEGPQKLDLDFLSPKIGQELKARVAEIEKKVGSSETPEIELPDEYADKIKELKMLDAGERVVHLYSIPDLKPDDGFYIVTSRKLAIYNSKLKNPIVTLPFSSMKEIHLEKRDTGKGEDSRIKIAKTDGKTLTILATPKEGRDGKLLDALKKNLEASQSDGEQKKAALEPQKTRKEQE